MPPIPRHIAAAALSAAALCIGAAPALASPTKSPTNPVTAKTPLVATIAAEVPMINEVFIRLGSADMSDTFYFNAIASGRAADAVSRIHADSAQLPAKLEWTLGAYLQERGEHRPRRRCCSRPSPLTSRRHPSRSTRSYATTTR